MGKKLTVKNIMDSKSQKFMKVFIGRGSSSNFQGVGVAVKPTPPHPS
jgi:hypothetical protein